MDFSKEKLVENIKNADLLPTRVKIAFLSVLPKLSETQLRKVFDLFLSFEKDYQKLKEKNKKNSQVFLNKKMEIILNVIKEKKDDLNRYAESTSKNQDYQNENNLLKELENL